MKKILYIILCFLAFVPSIVFASEKELNIYLFYGDGCPHCAAEEKFLNEYLKKEYQGKTIGIVAHRAPQLAFDVITKKITWQEAIQNDWRKTGAWLPGWVYEID